MKRSKLNNINFKAKRFGQYRNSSTYISTVIASVQHRPKFMTSRAALNCDMFDHDVAAGSTTL
jgi:hypothetical protein